MNKLIEFINDRINHYIKGSDIVNATPAVVIEVADDNWVTVKLMCNEATYKLRNLSGTTLEVGDSCQVYYKKSLMQSNAFVGAAQPRGGGSASVDLTYVYLTPYTGEISSASKVIARQYFVATGDCLCFLSFTSEVKGTEATNISFDVILDGVTVASFAQTLVVNGKENVSIQVPLDSVTEGNHTIKVKCNGHCNVVNIVAYIYGSNFEEYEMSPMYSLPSSATGLPLQAANSTLDIASIGQSSTAFTAGCFGYSALGQVWNGTDGIEISDTGYINHGIDDLSVWSVVIEIKGFGLPYHTSNRGYNLFNSFNDNVGCWYNSIDGRLVIRPQRGKSGIQLLTSLYGAEVGESGDRIYLNNINYNWLRTGTHKFSFGLKSGKLYFYIDENLICSQTYYPEENPINYINCGTFQRQSYSDWRTPSMAITKFEIYDTFIFD